MFPNIILETVLVYMMQICRVLSVGFLSVVKECGISDCYQLTAFSAKRRKSTRQKTLTRLYKVI